MSRLTRVLMAGSFLPRISDTPAAQGPPTPHRDCISHLLSSLFLFFLYYFSCALNSSPFPSACAIIILLYAFVSFLTKLSISLILIIPLSLSLKSSFFHFLSQPSLTFIFCREKKKEKKSCLFHPSHPILFPQTPFSRVLISPKYFLRPASEGPRQVSVGRSGRRGRVGPLLNLCVYEAATPVREGGGDLGRFFTASFE